MEARGGGDIEAMAALCDEAIELDPGFLDAHCMLLSHSDICLEDQVAVLCDLVMAGSEDLGHAFLRRHAGHLWSELEARPLLRTMGLLVVSLTELGDRDCLDEAIEVSELMLHIDAEDRLGVRMMLAPLYLARRRFDELRELLTRFEGDGMLPIRWVGVMQLFAAGGGIAARRLLPSVHERNPFAIAFLSGARRVPRYRPEGYVIGSEEEAIACADTLRPALRSMPKFRTWLKSVAAAGDAASEGAVGAGPLRVRRMRRVRASPRS